MRKYKKGELINVNGVGILKIVNSVHNVNGVVLYNTIILQSKYSNYKIGNPYMLDRYKFYDIDNENLEFKMFSREEKLKRILNENS